MINLFMCAVYEPDGDERELQCPKCGSPDLWLPDEAEDFFDLPDYLGKPAQCGECGHRFTVSENCWKRTGESNRL